MMDKPALGPDLIIQVSTGPFPTEWDALLITHQTMMITS